MVTLLEQLGQYTNCSGSGVSGCEEMKKTEVRANGRPLTGSWGWGFLWNYGGLFEACRDYKLFLGEAEYLGEHSCKLVSAGSQDIAIWFYSLSGIHYPACLTHVMLQAEECVFHSGTLHKHAAVALLALLVNDLPLNRDFLIQPLFT